MYTVPAQSILGRFFSNPGVHAEKFSDVPTGRPRIHIVEGDSSSKSVRGIESIYSASGTQQTLYDDPPLSASLPQSFPSNSAVSPAAMFLSGFSASPSTLSLPDDEGEAVADYILGPIIGYGGFSIVRRASSISGGVVAIKIVRRSDLSKQGNITRAQKRLDHETRIWSSLNHEHILPLFTSMHNSYADFFVTLYCPAGSLFDILKREGRPALQQDDAGMMFRQLVRGTRYLHEDARIVHCDMKLENVLVDESGTCKISDFGMAKEIGEAIEADEGEEEEDRENAGGFVDISYGVHRAASVSYATPLAKPRLPLHDSSIRPSGRGPRHRNSTTTSTPHSLPKRVFQPGSLPYAAPELLLPPSNSEPRLPHPAQDMWALGVMLYTLLSGRLPFLDSFEPRLQMKIMHGVFQMPSGVGRGTERILQGLMDKDAATRWTVAMVDEVAWGVGWGDEGDSVPVTDEELRQETTVSFNSRSQSRPHVSLSSTSPIAEVESDVPCSAVSDASARRSASRAQRSLSRAPVSARSRSLSKRSEIGRRRYPSPPTSAVESSIHSIRSSSTHSSISSAGPLEPDYAPLLSPSPLRGIEEEKRGRRLKKSSHITSMSRSPSPSVLPSTPSDVNPPRFISPPPLEERAEGSRASTSSIPRGRLRFPRIAPSHQSKSGTHTPLEQRTTPDVFSAEDEPEWHISSVEDGLLQANEMAASMAMDQDYLTSSESYFQRNISPPPIQSESRPLFHHRPGSIIQTKSEGHRRSTFADLALETSVIEVPENVADREPRRGHVSSSLERSHHTSHHHFHHPYNLKKQMRAGSTPPAPLSSLLDDGHTSTLRFSEHKSHSHSASHTPFSVYSHSHSSSRTSFGLLASEQTGPIRAMPVSAMVTPVVVTGVNVTSAAEDV
ncbi:hypothetical protein HHX47_DHR4000581 [Lentinula edodes]|nr:hypothetical protein HHX47_DHR4000581 [Lentinula edodes]